MIAIIEFVYIAYREHEHQIERKDLYNRLMAKDLTEYSRVGSGVPKMPVSPMIRNIVEQERELSEYMN